MYSIYSMSLELFNNIVKFFGEKAMLLNDIENIAYFFNATSILIN